MGNYIGDVHGKYAHYEKIIADCPNTIQVGDMGVGFRRWPHGEPYANPPHAKMVTANARFIRGNHDSPSVCRNQSQWIPDGRIEDNTMFIGGAVSIDREFRHEEYSWWPDEELSHAELQELVDIYNVVRPEIMVTHDAPQSAAEIVASSIISNAKMDPRWASRTRQALQSMLEIHHPKLWVFGHWHVSRDFIQDGTRFVCLAELECRELNI